ncbi:uncharacterized protein PAN0_058d6501 [Moesziomyces antarcticus]|uniref:Related to Myosin-like protein NUF2 n=2 Tax=Pseudozyma antarctica TaxID=84753 RepID=A0A5C3FVG9_PSEA2|nr:uncharacterized protein PAN0_058d6501 [Moesziomyces antarcticus]GAK68260.1 conserved hypothetical protein [Moesziomyces antarcticus]SPO47329.1 related to Myosin-like protein NUF2 [Moesziomyces antarcticus]
MTSAVNPTYPMSSARVPPDAVKGNRDGNYSSFPVVKIDELLGVLSEMGLSISPEDLQKPQGHVAHRVFVAFLECLSGTTTEMMDGRRHEALGSAEYSELYEDGLQMLMFFREVKDMMNAATLYDFTLQDLTRPNPKRFRRQMSALVNFYRFRSDRIVEFEELVTGSEDLENKRNEIEDDIDRQRSELARFKAERELDEPKVKELQRVNAEITDELLAARNQQKETMEELEELKKRKDTLAIKHAELAQDKFQIYEKITYLEARVVSSPSKMKNSVRELAEQLDKDTLSLQETVKKVEEFKRNLETLDTLSNDLDACMNAMHEVNLEMVKGKEEVQNQADLQALSQGITNQLASLKHSLEMTEYEMKRLEDKQNRNRKNLMDITDKHTKRMDNLQAEFEHAKQERNRKNATADAKNIESEKIEAKMAELEEAYEAYQKKMVRQKDAIETAVRLYISTLTNSLQLERFPA